jgi:CheY-like chemotaxis protein
LNPTILDAHKLVNRVVEICGEDIRSCGLELSLDLGAASHHVNGDAARLHQVLWNLLKNAVKFSHPGGRLTIATRNEATENRDGLEDALVIEVADTGIFDLIVSDLGLPDGNGLDLMRQNRSRTATKGIALSGFGMDDDVRKSREAGFVEHLTKPIDIARLEESILRVATM